MAVHKIETVDRRDDHHHMAWWYVCTRNVWLYTRLKLRIYMMIKATNNILNASFSVLLEETKEGLNDDPATQPCEKSGFRNAES